MLPVRYSAQIYVGAITTAIATAFLFILPRVLPDQPVRTTIWRLTGELPATNPLLFLVVLGGFFGGFVSGILVAGRWDTNLTVGFYAGVIGILIIYAVWILGNIIYWSIVQSMLPPPLFNIIVVPLIYFLPLTGTHIVGGMLGGGIGGWMAALYHGGPQLPDEFTDTE